jgi:hypothetical protein
MKKTLCTIVSIALLGAGAMAQQNTTGKVRCSTASPGLEWDAILNKLFYK